MLITLESLSLFFTSMGRTSFPSKEHSGTTPDGTLHLGPCTVAAWLADTGPRSSLTLTEAHRMAVLQSSGLHIQLWSQQWGAPMKICLPR